MTKKVMAYGVVGLLALALVGGTAYTLLNPTEAQAQLGSAGGQGQGGEGREAWRNGNGEDLAGGLAGRGQGEGGGGGGGGGESGSRQQGSYGAGQQEELSAVEIQGILYMREEEKLARDVYLTLYDKWPLRPFKNISQAEQRHMDRIGQLLKDRKIKDPVVTDRRGVFSNAALAKLYTTLVAEGQTSETAALKVGAHIEELDIADIQRMRSHGPDAQVRAAYDSLECGSRNHLRAYTRQLSRRGVTYVPEHLSQAAFDAIIKAEHERCGLASGRGGRGRGNRGMPGRGGKGQGHGRGQR